MPFDGAVNENVAIVRRMREQLTELNGWCKNQFINGQGGMCLYSAQRAARGLLLLVRDPVDKHPVVQAMIAEAQARRPEFWAGGADLICAYNNAINRTEMLDYLDAVERRLEVAHAV